MALRPPCAFSRAAKRRRGQLPEAGALISYVLHLDELFRRAANYVDQILKGANPADLPVEKVARFELVTKTLPAVFDGAIE
jgi:ABC transporter substrate binding protein